jgi:serine/threonine protein kinase
MDDRFLLRVGDFDFASKDPKEKQFQGTIHYRAPEVLQSRYYDIWAADVYSLAICLFVLFTNTNYPFFENDYERKKLLWNRPADFWKEKQNHVFPESFKKLFEGMTKRLPQNRLTLQQIEESEWYQGEILSNEQLAEEMREKFVKAGIELSEN